MFKKLTMLALAVGALVAFAAPAAAQADELYEKVGGLNVPLEEGAEVTASSTNLVTTSPLGTLKCEKVTIHGEVTSNGPGSITIEETSTTVLGCNTTITNPESGDIHLSGGTGTSTGSSFLAACACPYVGNIPFSYETNTDTLNVTGNEQFSAPGACGKATMEGSFTLETSDGTPVFIS